MYKYNRVLTAFVVVATMIALSITLWTSHQASQQAECQSRVNVNFLETLKARAVIDDGDRESTRELFEQLLSANVQDKKEENAPTQEEADKQEFVVLERYFAEQRRLDALREKFKFPEDVDKC